MPFSSLELIEGPSAVAAAWQRALGASFQLFQAAFLQPGGQLARFVPCPRGCGCNHEVLLRPCAVADEQGPTAPAYSKPSPSPFVGVCQCESWNCDDLLLSKEAVVLWELSWLRLGRMLCHALGLDPRPADLGLCNTRQIGSWSADAVPVMLSVQSRSGDFGVTLVQLAARLRERFILLAPTSRWLDARGRELLGNAGAGFFDLVSIVHLRPSGELQPTRSPGEIFAKFTPQPIESMDGDVARRAFALVRQLDSSDARTLPSSLTVFRLYCMEDQSIGQIARKFHCSTATVFRRLRAICARTGVEPRDLRRLSPQFTRIETELTDWRARRIEPRRAIYDEEERDG